jgi:protein-S-isoprenylcysteine O-methyltransferase Ste14
MIATVVEGTASVVQGKHFATKVGQHTLLHQLAIIGICSGSLKIMAAPKLTRILLVAAVITALLLLGWGIRDTAGFFASPVRAAYLALVVIAMASAVASIQKPAKKGTRTPPWQRAVLTLVQLITIPLLVFLPYADKREILIIPEEWVRWLGLSVALAGYVITTVAVRTLGKNYSVYVTIQEQHQLVQNGIYGVVRNPIYLGILLSWPGACLVFRSWLVLPVFAFFLGFAVLRGAQEERVLREEFGGDFEAYCRRTWRIVPYIY